MTKQAMIGTISHGTGRTIDLLDAFSAELRRILGKEGSESWPYATTLRGADDCVAEIEETDVEPADAGEIVNELIDYLNEFAPPYCYFGSHEGDGSDFGFWPSREAIEDAVADGDLLRVEDAGELPEGYVGEWLLVNDHGNATLFTRIQAPQDVEAWSCV